MEIYAIYLQLLINIIMKGERTTTSLGVKTNKTIKRDPYGKSDHRINQFLVSVENKVMHNDISPYYGTGKNRVIQ